LGGIFPLGGLYDDMTALEADWDLERRRPDDAQTNRTLPVLRSLMMMMMMMMMI
jgi:hypothetical protein